MGIIYKVTNRIDGKIYIGQRKATSEEFLESDYYGSGKYVQLALAKHGRSNFSREVIDEAQSKEDLDQKERYWISFYKSRYPGGYNIAEGGWGGDNGGQNRGRKWSEETRRKTSNTLKRKYASGELLPTMLGKKHTDSARVKIKKRRSTQVISDASYARAVQTRRKRTLEQGYYHTEETKKSIGSKNSIHMRNYYANGGVHPRYVQRETRLCLCGCGESFVCKVTSNRKYSKSWHTNVVRGRKVLCISKETP